MAIEGSVVQLACFLTTHLRNVPYMWANPLCQQEGQDIHQWVMAGRIGIPDLENTERNDLKGEYALLGTMVDVQPTHVHMSTCTLDALETIRELYVDQAQKYQILK